MFGIRKRLALAGYRRLGSYLDRKHGGHRMFTVAEVRAAVHEQGFSLEHFSYACALYCTETEFAAPHARAGLRAQYNELRSEILAPVRAKAQRRHRRESGPEDRYGGGDSRGDFDGSGDGGSGSGD